MSTLNTLLQIGASGLAAQQERLGVIQNNVANATTPGYSRQRIDLLSLGSSVLNTDVLGVAVGGLQSIQSPLLERQMVIPQGDFGFFSAQSEIGALVEAAIIPAGGNDLSAILNNFFGAVSALSADPANATLRTDLVYNAEALTSEFNRVSSALTTAGDEVEIQASAVADEINTLLADIETLDNLITTAGNDAVGELVDARDLLVNEVSGLIGVRVVPTTDGSTTLTTLDGLSLISDGVARSVSVTQVDGDLVVQLDTGVGQPVALSEVGGQLGGLSESFSGLIGEQLNQLDQLAFELAEAVNAINQSGVALDGSPGASFFVDIADVEGAALQFSVSAEIIADPGGIAAAASVDDLPGGNTVLGELLALQDGPLAGGASAQSMLQAMTLHLGETINSAQANAETAALASQQLTNIQQSISGVSIEEEMIALAEAQYAYEAALKLISAGDEMFNDLLTMVG